MTEEEKKYKIWPFPEPVENITMAICIAADKKITKK